MFISKNISLSFLWFLIFSTILISSFSIKDAFLELREINNYDSPIKINWRDSENPQKEFLKLLNEFKKETQWAFGEGIYNILEKQDPDNGYLDALAIKILLEGSFEKKQEGEYQVISIKNEVNLKKAVSHFNLLLSKNKYENYFIHYVKEARKEEEQSYLGMLKDVNAIFKFELPELNALRNFGLIYLALDNPSEKEVLKRSKNLKSFADKIIKESALQDS